MADQPNPPDSEKEKPVEKEAWVKPEIVSIEPISSAQGRGRNVGDGTSNAS